MNNQPDQTSTEGEQKKEEAKTYTKEEVEVMLRQNKEEVRKEAITSLVQKNAEIKGDLIQTGADQFYNPGKWEIMRKMADDLVKSGALPKSDNAYTVMMKMQAGREMGLKPVESIKSFYIVNGVLSLYGDAVVRRLREHGWTLLQYKEEPGSCTATIKKGEEQYSETFTFLDAEKSGWTKSSGGLKPGWVDGINRRRKLRYGAISTLVKTYVPEVLGAAVDIAEIAEDTVPLYKKDRVEEALTSDVELDKETLDRLETVTELKELAILCKKIKEEKGPEYQKPLMSYYNEKKQQIEAAKKEEVV